MSEFKPLALTEFYRSLHARGETTDALARKLTTSPATLRKMISLLKRRRGVVWTSFLALLTDRERQLVTEVEQCSAWNIQQAKKRPHFTAEKAAGLAETYGSFSNSRDRLRAREGASA